MPSSLIYLGIMLVAIIIWFVWVKRPIYEAVLLSFLLLLAITGSWENVWGYIDDALSTSLLYSMVAFVAMSVLMTKTKVIDSCITIILSIIGRVTGGAGYAAVIASSFMGALSGSGPGNVMATGAITIPAMKRSGFPAHLAANVEAHASTMGNMIPPAGMIATAFAIYDAMYPGTYTISQFWVILWSIAIWFVLGRIITMYLMCRYYKVEAMRKEDIPSLRKSIKAGWKSIFLPIVVFLPFFLTSAFDSFFIAQLGTAGAKAFTDSILLYIPSLIVICGIWLSDKECRKKMTAKYMFDDICKGMLKVVPTASLVLFAYFVSNVLGNLGIEKAIGAYIADLNMSQFALAMILPFFTAILGMLIPGSTQVKIFGGIIISVLAAAGGNPILTCAMLPCICGAMHGVTPPYCTCVYTGMGIAQAELGPTLKNCAIWILVHYVMSVITLMGWLPIFGL